jgi:hypothetical protein
MSVSIVAPVASFSTSCRPVCAPRWKPMPMQISAAVIGTVAARER